ncbi:sensor histidine kinase [Virgibacillus halodenitrificans]|uniref:histidine kinase n=1 Tax=Virgibacillus halodenitrificans TaxID=1482 RepID=A0ABR7VRR2_VIRHA|nr:ATP-binding protein [Virgibacillus halodenitrificans]MBD1224578.1 PAS domain-containing protein [Virgibacillus halodenitrificans]
MQKRPRSFKKELIYSFLTIGLISIVLLGVFQIVQLSSLVKENQTSQMRVTRFLDDYIESYLQQHQKIIETMALNISNLYNEGNMELVEEKLQEIKTNYPGFVNLYVGDKDGQSLVFYPDVYTDGVKREHLNFSDRSYYTKLLETKDTVISSVFHGRGGTDILLVAIVSPIFDNNGEMQGYILGALDLNQMARYVSSRISGEASYAVILDQENNVIVHPEVDTETEMVNLSDSDIVKYIKKNEHSGINSMTNEEPGEESEFITYTQLEESGWKVYVANPSAVITKPFKKAMFTIIGFILITSLLVVIVSLILTDRLEKTIRKLLEYIKTYSTSYKTSQSLVLKDTIRGPQEMNELLVHFNEMMQEIEKNRSELVDLNIELEERVKERTSNLEQKNLELRAVNKLITSVSSQKDIAHFIQHCLKNMESYTEYFIHILFLDMAITTEVIQRNQDIKTYLNNGLYGAKYYVEPISINGKPKGFLIVDLQEGQAVSNADQEFLQTFAKSLAIMLQNKVLYERYRNKHAELEAVLESMSEGIMLLNNDKQVDYVNEFFLSVIDNEANPVRIDTLADVYERFMELFELTAEDLLSFFEERDGEMKLEYKKKSGKVDFYMLHKFSVESEEERIGEGLLIRDITREEEIDTLKNNLISLTSHEFKTPITNIRGSVETLLRLDVEWDPEFQQELLEGVHEDIKRIQHLIDDWMDISKIESGTMYVERNMIRADHVVEESMEMIPMALKENAKLQFLNNADDYLFFYADKRRVQQVLLNLFTNALRYNDEVQKEIDITLGKTEEYLTIQVADNGIGISQEHVEKIFNRFYQVDVTATRRSGGTGLGLAICKGIMDAHDGKIIVESIPGEGSKFILCFPLKEGV